MISGSVAIRSTPSTNNDRWVVDVAVAVQFLGRARLILGLLLEKTSDGGAVTAVLVLGRLELSDVGSKDVLAWR